MKLSVPLYCMFSVVVFLCGCETIGAFGTGRITNADVAYIAHSGQLVKGTAPVDVNSTEPDEDYDMLPGKRPGASSTPVKADAWLEKNLW
jgi:hypothetical protein